MSDSPINIAIADATDEAAIANANFDIFESGVAVAVVPKRCKRKDETTFTKALAAVRTKFKPEGAEGWQESKWFTMSQIVVLRDKCNEIIAEMEAIEAATA